MQQTMSFTIARAVRAFDHCEQLADANWRFDWFFDDGDPAFDGHFPGRPVLPGVFLMEMAQQATLQALAQSGHRQPMLTRIRRFRFMAPILPGQPCTLALEGALAPSPPSAPPAGATQTVTASFTSNGRRIAHGLLDVRTEADGV